MPKHRRKLTQQERAAISRRMRATWARRKAASAIVARVHAVEDKHGRIVERDGAIVLEPIDVRAMVRERVQAEIRAAVREVLGE